MSSTPTVNVKEGNAASFEQSATTPSKPDTHFNNISRHSKLGNRSAVTANNQLKLKIPSAYTPDHWVCDHNKRRDELNADGLVVIPPKRRVKLKPFLTGVLRVSPTKDSNNKCDWRCDHTRKRCVKDFDYSMLNRSVAGSGRRGGLRSAVKSGHQQRVVRNASVKIDKSKITNRPLSVKSTAAEGVKSKPKAVGFNVAKLNFKKKLTSIKNKCLSLKNPLKPPRVNVELVKTGKAVSGKAATVKVKSEEMIPLLDEDCNTLDSIMSEGFDLFSIHTIFYF
jgi:hypothetical protein